MTTNKISSEQLEKSIQSLADNIIERRNSEVALKFKDREIKVDLNKPDEFFFKYKYDESFAYDEYLENLISATTNPTHAAIFVNYEQLLSFLSALFQKEHDSCGCTDSARTVLKYCLRRALGAKEPLQGESYYSPVYKNGEAWYSLICNHPFVRISKYREFSEATQNILNGLNMVKENQRKFASDCCDYVFMNPKNRGLTSRGFNNKEFNLFEQYVKCQDVINLYLYLKKDHPHLVKVYKKLKIKPPDKQGQLVNSVITLESFRLLKNGWFDKNDGTEYVSSDITKTIIFVSSLIRDHNIVAPYIYPLPDNEISLEWDIGDWMVSCCVIFNHGGLELHLLNTITNKVETLSLDAIEGKAEEVANFIIKIVNK